MTTRTVAAIVQFACAGFISVLAAKMWRLGSRIKRSTEALKRETEARRRSQP